MKDNQIIKLLKSQKILLQTKKNEVLDLVQAKQVEFNGILDMVMVEQGVPEKETKQWRLCIDSQAIEKMEPEKPPGNKEKKGKK